MVDGWEVRVCLFLLPLQGVITTRIHTQGDALGYMLAATFRCFGIGYKYTCET